MSGSRAAIAICAPSATGIANLTDERQQASATMAGSRAAIASRAPSATGIANLRMSSGKISAKIHASKAATVIRPPSPGGNANETASGSNSVTTPKTMAAIKTMAATERRRRRASVIVNRKWSRGNVSATKLASRAATARNPNPFTGNQPVIGNQKQRTNGVRASAKMAGSRAASGISPHIALTLLLRTSCTLIFASTIESAEAPPRTRAGVKTAAPKKGRFGTTDVRIASRSQPPIRVAWSRKETTARRPGGTVLTVSPSVRRSGNALSERPCARRRGTVLKELRQTSRSGTAKNKSPRTSRNGTAMKHQPQARRRMRSATPRSTKP